MSMTSLFFSLPTFPFQKKYQMKTRSNHRRFTIKKLFLKNFTIFPGKQLCLSHFLIKVQAFNFINQIFQQRRCLTVNIAKVLRTPFSTEHLSDCFLRTQSCLVISINLARLHWWDLENTLQSLVKTNRKDSRNAYESLKSRQHY